MSSGIDMLGQPSADGQIWELPPPLEVERFLLKHNLCSFVPNPGWTVKSVARAGDGNMNLSLRVTLLTGDEQSTVGDDRNFLAILVKQGRPFVERYPQFSAPIDRTVVELDFYNFIRKAELGSVPRLLAASRDQKTLILEYCREAVDCTSLYDHTVTPHDPDSAGLAFIADCAVNFLSKLHALTPPSESAESMLHGNDEMRALNHTHMYELPLQNVDPPVVDLEAVTTGLKLVADRIRADKELVARIADLGQLYISTSRRPNDVLLHGDFFPGSWLIVPSSGVEISDAAAELAHCSETTHKFVAIDFEFCFVGPAEFDLGILCAHFILCGLALFAKRALQRYSILRTDASFDIGLINAFAGAEIIRRILGLAQLPWLKGPDMLQRKVTLLEVAHGLVMGKTSLHELSDGYRRVTLSGI